MYMQYVICDMKTSMLLCYHNCVLMSHNVTSCHMLSSYHMLLCYHNCVLMSHNVTSCHMLSSYHMLLCYHNCVLMSHMKKRMMWCHVWRRASSSSTAPCPMPVLCDMQYEKHTVLPHLNTLMQHLVATPWHLTPCCHTLTPCCHTSNQVIVHESSNTRFSKVRFLLNLMEVHLESFFWDFHTTCYVYNFIWHVS
jgi:hypothetical protein